jgi:hypothetical protein
VPAHSVQVATRWRPNRGAAADGTEARTRGRHHDRQARRRRGRPGPLVRRPPGRLRPLRRTRRPDPLLLRRVPAEGDGQGGRQEAPHLRPPRRAQARRLELDRRPGPRPGAAAARLRQGRGRPARRAHAGEGAGRAGGRGHLRGGLPPLARDGPEGQPPPPRGGADVRQGRAAGLGRPAARLGPQAGRDRAGRAGARPRPGRRQPACSAPCSGSSSGRPRATWSRRARPRRSRSRARRRPAAACWRTRSWSRSGGRPRRWAARTAPGSGCWSSPPRGGARSSGRAATSSTWRRGASCSRRSGRRPARRAASGSARSRRSWWRGCPRSTARRG